LCLECRILWKACPASTGRLEIFKARKCLTGKSTICGTFSPSLVTPIKRVQAQRATNPAVAASGVVSGRLVRVCRLRHAKVWTDGLGCPFRKTSATSTRLGPGSIKPSLGGLFLSHSHSSVAQGSRSKSNLVCK